MKKFWWILGLAVLFLVVIGFLLIPKQSSDSQTSIPDQAADQAIVSAFFTGQDVYCLTKAGNLYQGTSADAPLAASFPSHYVFWCRTLAKFLFYNDRNLFTFDPETAQTQPLQNIFSFESFNPGHLTGVSGAYALAEGNGVTILVNLITLEKTEVSLPDGSYFTECNGVFYYFGSDQNSVWWFDSTTQSVTEQFLELPSDPVTSACVVNNTLYFTCQDKTLYRLELDSSQTGAAAIASGILSVTADSAQLFGLLQEDSAQGIVLCRLSPDGSVQTSWNLSAQYDPYTPWNTKLLVQNAQYAISHIDWDSVLTGTLSD